jgi:hypothetical protein
MMTFHAAWYREKFGKLGMICIAGPPNIAKTSSLKVAMHMASSSNYFFSMKVMNVPSSDNFTFLEYFRQLQS